MLALPLAQTIHDTPLPGPVMPLRCSLDYDSRFIRRKRLTTDCGHAFLVDFDKTISLDQGMILRLSDSRFVEIRAKSEALSQVTGPDLLRLAWHIGNRHTPCQIEATRLLIQRDHVIAHLVLHLGGQVLHVTAPFTPEGGAYGFGRTHAHEHVHSTHHGQ